MLIRFVLINLKRIFSSYTKKNDKACKQKVKWSKKITLSKKTNSIIQIIVFNNFEFSANNVLFQVLNECKRMELIKAFAAACFIIVNVFAKKLFCWY